MKNQALVTELNSAMKKTFDNITHKDNHAVLKESYIYEVFDNDVQDFMRLNFGDDYQENDNAQEFYEMQACDIRCNFEMDLREWMEENAEENPRIELNG